MGYGWSDPSAIPPPGLGQMQRAGVLVTPSTLLQVDVVFTALRIIDNHIMRMGCLRAYTEKLWGPDNVIYREFASDQPDVLTDMWGGRMMPSTGMSRTIWSMGLFGEAYWYVLLRDRLKYPLVLDVLHPAFMEVKQDEQGNPVYIYGTGAKKTRLDPDDVIAIPFKSLPASRRAMSPVEYLGVAGSLAMAAYEFGAAWFAQGAAPSYLLTTDAKLGMEEVQRIAQRFVSEHGGLSNAHLPLILDSGLKAQETMAAPDKAQYLQTLEYARSVVGSWFGINEEWLGNALQKLSPAAPGAFQDQQQRFNLHTLTGYTRPIEEAVSFRILPGAQKATFMEDELEQINAAGKAALVTSLRTSQSYAINDTRVRVQRIPPVDGGDDVIAPLASNVSPDQTSPPAADGPVPPKPDKEG